jgi:hypothetical protein
VDTGRVTALAAHVVSVQLNGSWPDSSAWNWSLAVNSTGQASMTPVTAMSLPADVVNGSAGEYLIALAGDENMLRMPRVDPLTGAATWGAAVAVSNANPDPSYHKMVLFDSNGDSVASRLGMIWDIAGLSSTVADKNRMYQATTSPCDCPSLACWADGNTSTIGLCPGWSTHYDFPNVTAGSEMAGPTFLALGPDRGAPLSPTVYVLADTIPSDGSSKSLVLFSVDAATRAVMDVGEVTTPALAPFSSFADSCCPPLVVEDGLAAGHDAVLVLSRLLVLYVFNASRLSAGPVWSADLTQGLNDVPVFDDPPVQCAGSALGWSSEAGTLYVAWVNHTDNSWGVAGVRIV